MSDGYMTDASVNTSGKGKDAAVPDEIKGWCWGAFFLSWVWAIGNKTWIGLLTLIPYVGFVMPFVLGFKGREWAWQNKQWNSVEEFNAVQKKWSFWGVIVFAVVFVVGFVWSAYDSYLSSMGG
ncbi:hypothetical protein [Litoribrevibacter albus]|uniref:Uncharacterized protein n=1 Tax=Litoribrevibacter albus TaxID=1473156 RepID=A0AA37SEV9_9GAMM|nr:hypothetical protein [Litoribrevibacter albus]GLQ33318.1 hypothetical protein GCM10007876_37980 [Litoribrevibacter albus]